MRTTYIAGTGPEASRGLKTGSSHWGCFKSLGFNLTGRRAVVDGKYEYLADKEEENEEN
jgi:hypothetical protein